MRILNLQNTVLVSLVVAGVAASACSSSNAARPTGDAGSTSTGGTSSGTAGSGTAVGGTGTVGTAGSTTAGGSTSVAGTSSGAGAGGTTTTGPSVCDGVASRVLMNTPTDAFIDDFEKEQNDPTTMMPSATQAAAGWYGFNDITPPNSVQILRTPGGAATTAYGGHYAGMGAKTPVAGGYGVGVEINVGINKSIMQFCVDASAFQGISFWAKAATMTNNKISAGFVVASQNQAMNGGDCPDTAPAAKCNNYPQKDEVLTTDWAQYTVDFADVTGSTGAKVVGGKIQQILWLAPTTDWDFSLDEVAFYSGTAPAGAVAPPASGSGGSGGAAQ